MTDLDDLMKSATAIAQRARWLGLVAAFGTWLAITLIAVSVVWVPLRREAGIATLVVAVALIPLVGTFDFTRRRCDSLFHDLSRKLQGSAMHAPEDAPVESARMLLDRLLEYGELPILRGRAGIAAYGVALLCIIAGAIFLIV